MKHTIELKPSYSILNLFLESGESITAESGSMVYMSGNMDVNTHTKGGVGKAIFRKVLTGEHFFMNDFVSKGKSALGLSSAYPGDISHHNLSGSLLVQSTSFLAAESTIEIDTKWGGLKTFFAKEGLFLVKLSGKGDVFLSSFGGILHKPLKSGEKFTIDTGHIVAFDDGMNFDVKKFGNWKSFFLGGEGLIAEFTGPGNLYIQSKSVTDFIGWMLPFLPRDQKGPYQPIIRGLGMK